MRLWSIHPKYLDTKGLVALWREGLLAQKVLKGETRGYRNHPQLNRFKEMRYPSAVIRLYLHHVYEEAIRRGFQFDIKKIGTSQSKARINLTRGQQEFEKMHLLTKLKTRDSERYSAVRALGHLEPHPIFDLVDGDIADWEIVGSEQNR